MLLSEDGGLSPRIYFKRKNAVEERIILIEDWEMEHRIIKVEVKCKEI